MHKEAAIHQVTIMLATFKNILFPGHIHRYKWPDTLIITWTSVRVIIKVSGHQYQWLAGGYYQEIGYI